MDIALSYGCLVTFGAHPAKPICTDRGYSRNHKILHLEKESQVTIIHLRARENPRNVSFPIRATSSLVSPQSYL